ncbi:MAG: hypothetical protein JXA54_09750 [Candidatus Heimdallarchaeota archaeon]|nr:hypothetical protein [Candidatus Heimdallarchaeota archaeon]
MNKKITAILVGLLGFLFISSILLGIYLPWKIKDTEIKFSHEQIIAYPSQTTWLLAEITTNYYCANVYNEIAVQVNDSIDFEYTIWSTQNNYFIVEIFLHPEIIHLNSTILVTLEINCDGSNTQKSVLVAVIDWTHNLPFEVEHVLNSFTDYLIANIADFTLAENNSLEFLGNIPQILVVEHYLFRSENWELELGRHVMIMPYDWVSLYIRPRNSFQPIWLGKIYSWGSSNHTIYEIEPPMNVFR